MQVLSLSCPSVTYAQKGRRILLQAGKRCRLTHRSRFGCAYGLECAAHDPDEILSLLREKGVPCSVVDRAAP